MKWEKVSTHHTTNKWLSIQNIEMIESIHKTRQQHQKKKH